MGQSDDHTTRAARREDVPRAVALHRAAILQLGAGFYTDRQLEAWAAEAVPGAYPVDDETAVLLIVEGEPGTATAADVAMTGATGLPLLAVGQLNVDEAEIAKLFVDPNVAGEGIGGRLLDRLEERAVERGITELFLDASLNAADFYHRRGYEYGSMLDKRLPIEDETVVYPALRMWKSFEG